MIIIVVVVSMLVGKVILAVVIIATIVCYRRRCKRRKLITWSAKYVAYANIVTLTYRTESSTGHSATGITVIDQPDGCRGSEPLDHRSLVQSHGFSSVQLL